MNYVSSYSYDGSGFDELNGNKKFDSDDNPYIHFEFALSDSGSAYFMDEKESFKADDILLHTVNVQIYSDEIKISHPCIPTEEWAKVASDNIIKSLMNRFDNFDCSTEEYNTNNDNYISCPHPHIDPFDIVTAFNDSLYNFHLEEWSEEELNNIGIESDEPINLHVLRGSLGNRLGIYYIKHKDSFYFENEDLMKEFDKMVFQLLVHNSPSEFIADSYPEIIDAGVLVLWVYWYGRPAVHFWDYVREYIHLDDKESYSRKNAFEYVRANSSYYLTTLQLRRLEADLIELLDYEYPIRDINRDVMIEYFESSCDKNIEKILWDDGLKDNINSYVSVKTSPTSFDYEQNIGFKGDIIYYESKKLPAKIALQLKKYDPVAPVKDKLMRFDESIATTPFAWYGKIIGVKKLDDDLTESEIREILDLDSLYILYNSIFESASQLRLKDLDNQLDIIFNEPDTTAWD